MSYAQIHTQAIRHRKVLSLSAPAFRVWVAGHCYCQEHLSDGQIPKVALVALGVPVKAVWVAELVAQALWHDVGDAYTVHDWTDWNATRAQVETRRKTARTRRARWQERQAADAPHDAVANGGRNGVTNGVRNGVHVPVPNARRNGSATQRNAEDQDQEHEDPGLTAGRPPYGNVEKPQTAPTTPRLVPVPRRPPDDAPGKVLTQVAVALLQRRGDVDVDEADLKEDFKRACAVAHLRYAAGDVRKALDAARAILARQQEAQA